MVKDVIFVVIGKYGVKFGIGYVIEYIGEVFRNMMMDEWMIVCNMLIEVGVRVGLIVFDEVIFEYCKNCKYMLKGEEFDKVVEEWRVLCIDLGVVYDKFIVFDGNEIFLMVIWGINLGMVFFVDLEVFVLESFFVEDDKKEVIWVYEYMGLIFY